MGRGCVSPLPACAVTVALFSAAVAAQDGRVDGRLFDAAVPGGIRGALSAVDDHVAADRSHFLLELIRRFHHAPLTSEADPRLVPFRALLAQLDTSNLRAGGAAAQDETVPLPLSPQIWIDVVFGGRATPETLVSAILRSRDASLLYCGLLSLDGATRQWLTGKPALIAHLASRHAAAFFVAAPGLRVKDERLQLPGGEAATQVWLALADQADEPEKFIRAVVEPRRDRIAYMLGALAQLTPPQISFALNLDARDPADRLAAARAVYSAFEQTASKWDIERQPFWRPAVDPALLLSELPPDDRGRPKLAGDRDFWTEVLAGNDQRAARAAARRGSPARSGERLEFEWLCARVFAGAPFQHRRNYNVVLFAARNIERIAPDQERDAMDAVRAAGQYPALNASLERAGLADVGAFAAAARRAARLNAIRDRTRAIRALLQFQGALALITRASAWGGLPPESLAALVSSLSAVDVSEPGDYEGRLVRWLDAHLSAAGFVPNPHSAQAESAATEGNAAGSLEQHLLRSLAGVPGATPAFVDWEGTRYRVDLSAAEATRLTTLLGDEPRPFITSARALANIADALENGRVSAVQLNAAAARFAEVGEAIGDELADGASDRYRDISASLQRVVRTGDVGLIAPLSAGMRQLADDLLASGLAEFAYATALGQPGEAAISPGEASRRHDLGLEDSLYGSAWQLPEAGLSNKGEWRVTGSLLGLDVKLARFSLMRVSARPPARKPSLNDIDRRVFVETVTLAGPASLSDIRREAMLDALRRGRARVAAAHSGSEVLALADDIRLSPSRRALLAWAVVHEPDRVRVSFSLAELLWLGVNSSPAEGMFDVWGASGEPRLGCLCPRLIDRRPWEMLAGRWNTGMFASGFADLNLRLAELLLELQMPAALFTSVLGPATVDFVENAPSRDQDDRRALVEFVQAVSRERLEEYLALLTTGGPLAPVGDAAGPASYRRSPR